MRYAARLLNMNNLQCLLSIYQSIYFSYWGKKATPEMSSTSMAVNMEAKRSRSVTRTLTHRYAGSLQLYGGHL